MAVALLLLFSLFLHIYRLGELPKGMDVDEVGMAYDSWCIGHYGVDRYLKSLPVYLNNYGGGQSVMYCYLAIPFVMAGSFNAAMARMPGLIFSMITGVVGFALIKKIRGRAAGLIYLFLFAALPYFTQSGRVALDCNLMLGCVVIILYILEFCLGQDEKALGCYLLLGIVTGISLYSYALSNMILPLFFLLLYPFLRLFGKKISLKQILVFFIPAFVIAIPLILVQVVNILELPDMMIGPFTIPRIHFYRLTEISFSEIRPNITYIYQSLFTSDNQEFDSFPQFGSLYIISLPMIVAGGVITLVRCVRAMKKKVLIFDGVILLFTFVMFAIALVLLGVTTYRINAVFFGLTFLIMVPIEACLKARGRALRTESGDHNEGRALGTKSRGHNEGETSDAKAKAGVSNSSPPSGAKAKADVINSSPPSGAKADKRGIAVKRTPPKQGVWLGALGVLILCAYTVYAALFINYYFTRYEFEHYPQRLFAENPREVFEFLDGQDEDVRERLTYMGGVNEAYAYYLLSMGISPYEYDVNKWGNNGDGERFLFYAPEPYTAYANYVFYVPDEEIDGKLKALGFTRHDVGAYAVYLWKH